MRIITTEKSTQNLRGLCSSLEDEKTLEQLYQIALYAKHQLEEARKTESEELIRNWELMSERVETTYRVANLGMVSH